jgi:hypothetical protein
LRDLALPIFAADRHGRAISPALIDKPGPGCAPASISAVIAAACARASGEILKRLSDRSRPTSSNQLLTGGVWAKAHFALAGRSCPQRVCSLEPARRYSTADRRIFPCREASWGWPVSSTDTSFQRHPARADPLTSGQAPGRRAPGSSSICRCPPACSTSVMLPRIGSRRTAPGRAGYIGARIMDQGA